MYIRRASVKHLLKVCSSTTTRPPRSLNCIKYQSFVRNLSTATQRSDFYGVPAENHGNGSEDNRFHGANLGGVDQNQNPSSGVYGQNLGGQYGNFAAEGKGFNPKFDGTFNQQGGSYFKNLGGGVEQSQNPNGVYGHNTGKFVSGHVRNVYQSEVQQNWIGHSAGNAEMFKQNYGGSYGGNAGNSEKNSYSDQQVGSGVYYSNHAVNYQQNQSEFHSGGVIDRVANGMNLNEVEVAEGSPSKSKVEELDELCKEGKLKEAVELLGVMEQEDLQVDLPRYLALMKACGENKALEEAKTVHEHLVKSIPHLEVRTYNQILEMYSKCGSMDHAFAVFDQMPTRNLTSWDIMIYWLAKNGLGEDSIDLFTEFKRSSGLKPDDEMFIGVFSACGVLGDIVEGLLHFESMTKDFGIVPSMKQYVGVVEMLGSAGCLDEALEFIEKMPVEPGVEIWETLMNFGRIHGNTELGDRCAELVELLDPSRLNEHSQAGLIPVNAAELAREKERKKLSGQSLLDVRSRVHEYRAGDRSHPEHEKIYALLRGLKQQMKEVGYIPETKFVLHDVDQDSKEEALMAHSERLAAAQGFMTTPARSPMRIIKNLRVCGDCHNAFKIISKIVGREIIARDSKRFHHFRDGSCSCNDYW